MTHEFYVVFKHSLKVKQITIKNNLRTIATMYVQT